MALTCANSGISLVLWFTAHRLYKQTVKTQSRFVWSRNLLILLVWTQGPITCIFNYFIHFSDYCLLASDWLFISYHEDTGMARLAWCASRFGTQTPPSDTGFGRAAHRSRTLVPRRNRSPCSTYNVQTAAPPDNQTRCCTDWPGWILSKKTKQKSLKRPTKIRRMWSLNEGLTCPLIVWAFHLITRGAITQFPG